MRSLGSARPCTDSVRPLSRILALYACSVGFASCETWGKHYRASLHDPQVAGSPPRHQKSRAMPVCDNRNVAGGVSNCGRLGRRVLAPTLCDRYRASLRVMLALLVSHRAKLGASTIVHPCTTRKLRVLPPGTKNSTPLVERGAIFGADGGGRTRTVLLPTDFESVTSANSITSAYIVFVKAHYITIITISQFDYYIIAEKYCQ